MCDIHLIHCLHSYVIIQLNFPLCTLLDGTEALQLFKTNYHIHLILTDLIMPLMDGYELTRLIRKLYSKAVTSDTHDGSWFQSSVVPGKALGSPVIVALSGATEGDVHDTCLQVDLV